MARELPWAFPYVVERNPEDHPLGRTLLRPLVEARIIGATTSSNRVAALIDSGSDYTLAAPHLALEANIDVRTGTSTHVRVGGASREISVVDTTIRLCDPLTAVIAGCEEVDSLEWQAEVGFFKKWDDPPFSLILGQVGFFDRFTVVMNRFAQGLALERLERFDEWYGPL